MTEAYPFPALEPCEEALDDPSEWYYRQIHPTFVSEGVINPDAFRCDDRKLSGARSTKQTPQGAFEEYRNLTAGTWGVTLAQVVSAKGRLVDDSECPPPTGLAAWPTGHTYLDQRIEDKNIRKKMRFNLARVAASQGRLHPPPD